MLLQHEDSDGHKMIYQHAKSAINFFQCFAKKSWKEDVQIAKGELPFAGYSLNATYLLFMDTTYVYYANEYLFPKRQIASEQSKRKTKSSYVILYGSAFH